MLSGLRTGSVTDLKKSSSEGNCHRIERVWKALLQGLTIVGTVEMNVRRLQNGTCWGAEAGEVGCGSSAEQLGLNWGLMLPNLKLDIEGGKAGILLVSWAEPSPQHFRCSSVTLWGWGYFHLRGWFFSLARGRMLCRGLARSAWRCCAQA